MNFISHTRIFIRLKSVKQWAKICCFHTPRGLGFVIRFSRRSRVGFNFPLQTAAYWESRAWRGYTRTEKQVWKKKHVTICLNESWWEKTQTHIIISLFLVVPTSSMAPQPSTLSFCNVSLYVNFLAQKKRNLADKSLGARFFPNDGQELGLAHGTSSHSTQVPQISILVDWLWLFVLFDGEGRIF